MTVAAKIAVAQVVREDDDDVRSRRFVGGVFRESLGQRLSQADAAMSRLAIDGENLQNVVRSPVAAHWYPQMEWMRADG